uniref:PH domain-containing protein n=1 Tax=Gasterosteus aculeatus aculeatus TaxID=481459 RepID=A0AAQ4RKW0_GASAC|nr:myosin phosphatase Rho-interacting protein-like [Gasterosteus aculeatus aculeatus]
MSGEKATSPCNKFQANIFNKSKCQNCFKSRELHLLTDNGREQAKPLYGGWLCLAPEGTDFENPMQRSRKWQRRFFILYEDGSLSFALDELPSTLPQGTVNLNVSADIADAEPRTGQRNALCIATPEQEIFIRGDNKEIINGWTEQLAVYLRTSQQNQKKKRKVEPVATQEPSAAKMAAADPSSPSLGNAAESGSGRRQEDPRQGGGPGETPIRPFPDSDPRGLEETPAGYLSPASLDLVTGGNTDLASRNQLSESNNIQTSARTNNQSQDKSRGGPTERLLGLEATENEPEAGTAVSRVGRSEARTNGREKLQSRGDTARLAAPPPQRRAKSLDRRTSDTVMTPDLLNFKKGWMVKLDENEQWKKYWFVLSMDSLRCYKDSVAEEASDLEGEIDLTRCYNVSEYQVQRNYGFQIHTPKGVFTLSAMTSGIRKNWIQALMKSVRPARAPDVASLPVHRGPTEALPKPDVTRDSGAAPPERDPRPERRTVTERRRKGRYKTFDWAEFRPQGKQAADPPRATAPCSLEIGELERRKRREERRRRYESMLGFPLGWEAGPDNKAPGARALSPKSQRRVEEEIEECWRQVEKTVFRLERKVPLISEAGDCAEAEKLLDGYVKGVEDLKARLAESERQRLDLEARLAADGFYAQQSQPLTPGADFPSDRKERPLNGGGPTRNVVSPEARELLQQQNLINAQEQLGCESPPSAPQMPGIWLRDTEGNSQEVEEPPPGAGDAALLSSPASGEQALFSQSEGPTAGSNAGVDNEDQLDRGDIEQVPSPESQTENGEFSSLILETPSEGDDDSLGCCVELRSPADQAVVRRLSREVELLTGQNEALNRRNQEMLNQLTEADREIERLKAELSSRYTEPHHLPEVEQLGRTRVEDLEGELSARDQQLLEAQTVIASLEENLRETEELLQLNVPRETEEENKGYLLRCFEATEAKLTELERKLEQSERTCMELHAQNAELREAQERCGRRAAEAEADVRRLNQELEMERLEDGEGNACVSGEERIQEVIDGMVVRLKALEKLLEVIDKFDCGLRKEEEETTVQSQLLWEEEFWGFLLDKLKANRSQLNEEEPVEELLAEVTERMMAEKQMLLLGSRLLSETSADGGLKELDIILNIASETESNKTDGSRTLDSDHQLYEMEYFRSATRVKISLLNRLSASDERLRLTADLLRGRRPRRGFVEGAATEALYCCRLSRLRSKYERRLEETRQQLLASSLVCSDCVALLEENRQLREKVSHLEAQRASPVDEMDACCQTEEADPDVGSRVADRGVADDTGEEEEESPETPLSSVGGQSGLEETKDGNTEMVSVLRRRVEELEEQLAVMAEMKEELDGKMGSDRAQHETEMEKLKATCERGFASMEESHLKVVEELQHRHRQEVERLLVERDGLLEEESAATATAIEAIKNAHRLELEKEVQRRCQSQDTTGSTHLEDVHRQHREELASYQRELEVLSQQFSLKCLENGHLVQAVDAERKALCQCQQENQDLRTRNQELSGHLAAEITRLCSLAKQDALPLSQGMDVYEMEITLRVKESEVQCLKQEITSLRDDLQAAQRDKRSATKKCKDVYAELSITRAKAEREMEALRENLRLAHRALDHNTH